MLTKVQMDETRPRMPRQRRGATVRHSALFATLVAGGCSTMTPDFTPCDSTRQCQRAFGLGSQCGDDGYCTETNIIDRCRETYPHDLYENHDAYPDRVLIGTLYSYDDHRDTQLATELAFREINSKQDLDGRQFALVHCDYTDNAGDELDNESATELTARYLAEVLEVPAIIGPRGSLRTERAYLAVKELEVLVISPSATSVTLTDLDEASDPTDETPGQLWRTAPPDSLQSEVIADDMTGRGKTSAAVIYQQGTYGEGLKRLFISRFLATGGTAAEFPFSDQVDIPSEVASVGAMLGNGEFDEVLFVSSDIQHNVEFLNAASATDELQSSYTRPDVGLFLADFGYNQLLLDETTPEAQVLFGRIRGSRPAPASGQDYNAFAATYSNEFDADPMSSAYTPHAYDAGWLVALGVAWAHLEEGEITAKGIARGFRRFMTGDVLSFSPSAWDTALDGFRSGQTFDVTGASGPLNYDLSTEELIAPIELWQIALVDGEFAFVELDRIEPS